MTLSLRMECIQCTDGQAEQADRQDRLIRWERADHRSLYFFATEHVCQDGTMAINHRAGLEMPVIMDQSTGVSHHRACTPLPPGSSRGAVMSPDLPPPQPPHKYPTPEFCVDDSRFLCHLSPMCSAAGIRALTFPCSPAVFIANLLE